MSVYLAPTFGVGWQAFTVAGLPLNVGKLYTYIAGGTTPQATYTTSLGNVQNSNPITLGVDGRPPSEIWLTNGVAYRFDLKDALGNLIKTYDDISMSSFVATADLADTGGSALVGFIQGGTSPTAETVQTALRRVVYPEQFGAVGNGSTDDRTALTNFLNYLLANTQVEGHFLSKTYAISGALPQITVSGTRLIGFGPFGVHNTGNPGGTVIKAITNSGFTMLTVAPTEGATAQYLFGVQIKGITFDCNDVAAKGLVMKSMRYCDYDVCVLNATTTGWEMNVSTTLGDPVDSQFNRIRYMGRQSSAGGAAGISLRLIGSASGNWSFNLFELVDIYHKDGIGIIEENADNNEWLVVRVFRDAGGAAVNSIEWRGGATSATSCRSERFQVLSTTVAAIAKGTGTYTVAAQDIYIYNLDKGNNTPTPTEETAATIFDGEWRSYTVTLAAGGGLYTLAAAAGRKRRRDPFMMDFESLITITTNGTASTFTRVSLPTTASASVVSVQIIGGIESAVTGFFARGQIISGSTSCDIQAYDGSYLGGDGRRISINGRYAT